MSRSLELNSLSWLVWSEMMEFRKCKRDANEVLSGDWRLASVQEVTEEENYRKLKESGIINSWDTARLLDGYVEGKKRLVKQYKANLEHMIVVKPQLSKQPDEFSREKMHVKGQESWPSYNDFLEQMYSGVDWTTKGGQAAVLFSCEDKITESICFVLYSIVKKFQEDGKRQHELKELTKTLQKEFRNGRTLLHYAVDQPHKPNHGLYVAECLKNNFKTAGEDLIKTADIHGRTALHFAAYHGNTELCTFLIHDCNMRADKTDVNKENILHFAINGKNEAVFKSLCKLKQVQSIIGSADAQGKTALHKAAAQGSIAMITTLLLSTSTHNDKLKFIRQHDFCGQTALLEAVSGGHEEAVELLLENESDPLSERNSDGRTALHYAVQLSEEKAKSVAEKLLTHCESVEKRSLLLWASAAGMGTAEEYLRTKREKQRHKHEQGDAGITEKYLRTERERTVQISKELDLDLLSTAIDLEDEKMAWELVTRCANTTPIVRMANCNCLFEKQRRAKNLLGQLHKIDEIPEQGREQPAIYDTLGREEFAQGLAELFLNPYVKSPVTVGISGEWGMGKSSLMVQTEIILLKTAAQLAFPSLLPIDEFPGCRQIKQTSKGQRIYGEMNKMVKNLVPSCASEQYPLLHFLDGDYREEDHDIYKSLALIDRCEMFEMKAKHGSADSTSNQYPLIKIPAILTVRYNAWHYQDQSEAWAGLAVEVTKAIEGSMTTAQRVRSDWTYAWKKQGSRIWSELILPFFFAFFLSSWVALVLWKLISRSKNNELVQLAYGSIPITLLLAFWTVMRQFFSVIKPVSTQVMGYFTKADHTTKLGYQHQVIFDITFLKEQIGEKPSCKWKFVGWLCNLLHLYPQSSDTVKGTSISKTPAPGKEDIRMIVFVDDLDRCEDSVILKVLSAVNLVLAACNINVILGMDEKMIERAMKDNKELAKRYMSKIVQLPLALPDTSEDETKEFLRQRLGEAFQTMSQKAEDKVPEQASTDKTACDNQSLPGQCPDHVCLEVRDDVPANCRIFFSKICQIFKRFWSFKNSLLRGPEETEDTLIKKKLRTMPLNFRRIMPNYSDEERKALEDLSEAATGERKLPREWKRFLTYHRVAWNILSQSEKVKKTPGWQMQLVVWLFCCWQWEDQINEIIKDWNKLVPVNGFFEDGDDCLQSNKPSLRNIVEHYALHQEEGNHEEREDEGQKETETGTGKMKTNQDEDENEEGEDKNEEGEDENEEDKKKKEQRQNWYSLKRTLDTHRYETYTYDVSLDCILSFQKFRLYCDIGHLSSPKTSGNRKDKASTQDMPRASEET